MFIDKRLERVFEDSICKNVRELSSLATPLFAFSVLLNIAFQIFKISQYKEQAVHCITSFVIQILGVLIFTFHFWLAKNRKHCATHFACIQSIITFVSVLEGAMQGNKILEESDGLLTAASFIACLSTISYNQYKLLRSYLTCSAYSWIRTYFTLGTSDLARYFKFNISVVIVLILIYVFSRRVNQTQRLNFI